jgi:hypothetical protein
LPPVTREAAMPARPWIDQGKRAWEERDIKAPIR